MPTDYEYSLYGVRSGRDSRIGQARCPTLFALLMQRDAGWSSGGGGTPGAPPDLLPRSRARAVRRPSMRCVLTLACLLWLGNPLPARAGAWIWDNDGDRLDDRFVAVATGGISAAYTGNDPVHGLLRFQVSVAAGVT